ncbi:hypothetical protein J8273_0795 [Carpediemonas membranifera]|uniref:Uncharacterized protein n=1 Tax=Carpediemonas membranifera TaxID=201153 RepID=A0A8J6B3P3_9EUKA|nr:hypothetical protein J8273_0795 [Carpediemonas membranifera]|eukprot:KAG9397665.1 hypothetical protein J8273_0795 [Carpediemonas membranifera]
MAKKAVSICSMISTDQELLKSLRIPGLACLEIGAEFCGFAKAMEQTTRRLSQQAGERPVKFFRMVAETSELFRPLWARSSPTFIFVKNGVFVQLLTGLDPTTFVPAFENALPASLEECPAEKSLPEFDFEPIAAVLSKFTAIQTPAEYEDDDAPKEEVQEEAKKEE